MRYKSLWNVDINLKPVFMAGITRASGNSVPLMVPNKALYMHKDLLRCAKYFDVPLTMVSVSFCIWNLNHLIILCYNINNAYIK